MAAGYDPEAEAGPDEDRIRGRLCGYGEPAGEGRTVVPAPISHAIASTRPGKGPKLSNKINMLRVAEGKGFEPSIQV